MNSFVGQRLALVVALVLLCSCGSGSPTSPASGSRAEGTGQLSLAITTVPPGVQCISITATGAYTVTQTFAATPGAGTVASLALGELPLGAVAITGQAFNVACAAIGSSQPSWVADKQTVNLAQGVITSLTITFRPDNAVTGTPTFVGNVVQLSVGASDIALVMSDGTVEATGYVGSFSNTTTFGVVSTLTNVQQLASSSTGIFGCALLKNATVECWGDNTYGELGNGTTTSSGMPVPVMGLTNVVEVTAGYQFACALESNHTLWCWGESSCGQLGNGGALQPNCTSPTTHTSSTVPVQVTSLGSEVLGVAANWFHACAIANVTPSGDIFCWGYNGYGQLGNNTTTTTSTPVLVPGLFATSQLPGTLDVNTCALRQDGTAFSWGAGGGNGNGSGANALTPTQVVFQGSPASSNNVVQLVAGGFATCARRSDGSVWCWGDAAAGATGDGIGSNMANTLSPTQVIDLPPSVNIAAGYSLTCSLGTDNSLSCWGQSPAFINDFPSAIPVTVTP
jgi:alpha-tubulin suppressor-like RCC1 family protein